MQLQTLERRLELLKLEGNGLNRREIVEELSAKYTCSKDTLWYDFRTKPNWQPAITEVKQALHTIINRHEQLYRKASLCYIQAENNPQKIAAVNLMKNINAEAFEMLQSSGILTKTPDNLNVKHVVELIDPAISEASSNQV